MLERKELTPVKDLFEKFKQTRVVTDSKIENFVMDDGSDCYNPSIPFLVDGKEYILARTQQRKGAYSKVYFFKKENDKWVVDKAGQVFDLEDPSIVNLNGVNVISGVNVVFGDGITTFTEWKTDFYVGTGINGYKKFATGPAHMKDIRLVQLKDGKVGIFTRPLGEYVTDGHKAKVGFTIVDKIEDLNADVISKAPLLEDFFLIEEWGGCNCAYQLKNGLIGVIGHRSYGENIDGVDILHYFGTYFIFDPATRKSTNMNVIISRDCFPYFEPREPRLADVTFTAGIVRNGDGTARIYTGLSDSAIGSATIKDPFVDYE